MPPVNRMIPSGYNRSLEVDGGNESVGAGALRMRLILESSGAVPWLEDHLIDGRRPGSVVHGMENLIRTCLLRLCRGHRDQDDGDLLCHDPALAAAAKSTGDPVRGDGSDRLPSQPSLSRFVDLLSREANLYVLKEGILANGLRPIR